MPGHCNAHSTDRRESRCPCGNIATRTLYFVVHQWFVNRGVRDMSKGMDKKKETKKKAEKTLKEKRAAKQAKKATRG